MVIVYQIDEWVDYASVFSSGSEFENACSRVDNYLQSVTFLVGHTLSVADVAVWSALAGKVAMYLFDSLFNTLIIIRIRSKMGEFEEI